MGDAKFKLEDILNKQKAPPQILDLANIKIDTEEEFKNVIEKIPDYRIKPERPEETTEQMQVLQESIKRYKKFRRNQLLFNGTDPRPQLVKKASLHEPDQEDGDQETDNFEATKMTEAFGEEPMKPLIRRGVPAAPPPVPEIPYEFADPCPTSMRDVNISDLSSVNINWKMLTLARPKTKTDEEIFSKLVQLDKLRLQTRAKEEEQSLARGGKDPFIVVKNPSASKGGVAETSIKVCSECAEEFCSGTCKDFQYDSYQRLIIQEKEKDQGVEALAKGKTKKGKKGKGGKKKKKEYSLTRMPVDF